MVKKKKNGYNCFLFFALFALLASTKTKKILYKTKHANVTFQKIEIKKKIKKIALLSNDKLDT